jgi:hypothetical protein
MPLDQVGVSGEISWSRVAWASSGRRYARLLGLRSVMGLIQSCKPVPAGEIRPTPHQATQPWRGGLRADGLPGRKALLRVPDPALQGPLPRTILQGLGSGAARTLVREPRGVPQNWGSSGTLRPGSRATLFAPARAISAAQPGSLCDYPRMCRRWQAVAAPPPSRGPVPPPEHKRG